MVNTDSGRLRVLVQRLGRGHLHRLLVGHDAGLVVAGDEDADAGDDDPGAQTQRGPEHLGLTAAASCQVLTATISAPAVRWCART